MTLRKKRPGSWSWTRLARVGMTFALGVGLGILLAEGMLAVFGRR